MRRILDLCCGAGGAAVGYQRAGFDVFGVDIAPQRDYPFPMVVDDAVEYLRDLIDSDQLRKSFQAVHISAPCQRWSTKTKDRERHPDLITPVRMLLQHPMARGIPYVMENVPGAPLIEPVRLCGSAFGLGVRRHRHFESNVALTAPPCDHANQPKRYRLYDHGKWYMSSVVHVFGTGGGKGREHWNEAMGIDWTTSTDGLREAIPPAYTTCIGNQLMSALSC